MSLLTFPLLTCPNSRVPANVSPRSAAVAEADPDLLRVALTDADPKLLEVALTKVIIYTT